MGIVLDKALDVGLGTIAKSSIRIMEEIPTKVLLGLLHTLQLVFVGVGLQGIHEFLGILHCNK